MKRLIISALVVRIKKTIQGVITTYIKGGSFGDTWVLADSSNSGANPYTNTSIYGAGFFVLDFDAGDRITNLMFQKDAII